MKSDLPNGYDACEQPQSDPSYGLEFPSDISLETQWNDLIDGVIGCGDLCVLYGPSGSGKTFCIIDLCFRLALGKNIAGRATRATAVLYIGYEGERGLKKRIRAALDHHGDPGHRFARLILDVPLDRGSNGRIGAAKIVEAIKRLLAVSGAEDCLIVIDTLARAMAGDDESAAKDMASFIVHRAGFMIRETGAAILCVHHPGKDTDKGMRGSSSLYAACDAVINIKDGTAALEKVKDGEEGDWFHFKLAQVVLGVDDRGADITTCVVDYIDGELVSKRARKLNAKEQRILEYIQHQYDDQKDIAVIGHDLDIASSEYWKCVSKSALQQICREGRLTEGRDDDTPKKISDRERQAFRRGLEGLFTKGDIRLHGDHIWLVGYNRKRSKNGATKTTTGDTVASVACVKSGDVEATDATPPFRGVACRLSSQSDKKTSKLGSLAGSMCEAPHAEATVANVAFSSKSSDQQNTPAATVKLEPTEHAQGDCSRGEQLGGGDKSEGPQAGSGVADANKTMNEKIPQIVADGQTGNPVAQADDKRQNPVSESLHVVDGGYEV